MSRFFLSLFCVLSVFAQPALAAPVFSNIVVSSFTAVSTDPVMSVSNSLEAGRALAGNGDVNKCFLMYTVPRKISSTAAGYKSDIHVECLLTNGAETSALLSFDGVIKNQNQLSDDVLRPLISSQTDLFLGQARRGGMSMPYAVLYEYVILG